MQVDNKIWIFLLVATTTIGGLAYFGSPVATTPSLPPSPQLKIVQPLKPRLPAITAKIPGYQAYDKIVAQLEEWKQQAPDLAETGTYGTSTKGKQLHYIKITNKFSAVTKPVILVHGCIHGNESWATGEVMAWLGTMLGTYGQDKQVTNLLDSNEIYFVPVISPDSYPNSREVDGVDPNRNFGNSASPNPSAVAPIAAIQNFFLKIKPKAAISAHTSGRVFLSPWGEKNEVSANEKDYQRIFGKMCELSGYGKKRACEVYGHPIMGGELDWYFKNRAFSAVFEIGSHQTVPSMNDIQSEFNKTYRAFLYFLEEAVKVEVKPTEYELQEAA